MEGIKGMLGLLPTLFVFAVIGVVSSAYWIVKLVIWLLNHIDIVII